MDSSYRETCLRKLNQKNFTIVYYGSSNNKLRTGIQQKKRFKLLQTNRIYSKRIFKKFRLLCLLFLRSTKLIFQALPNSVKLFFDITICAARNVLEKNRRKTKSQKRGFDRTAFYWSGASEKPNL